MNWEYPDEITPLPDRVRPMTIGLLLGAIIRIAYLPLVSAVSGGFPEQPWPLFAVMTALSFMLGVAAGWWCEVWMSMRNAHWKVGGWALLFGTALTAVPFDLFLFLVVLVYYLPLLGFLALVAGLGLGLKLKRRQLPMVPR